MKITIHADESTRETEISISCNRLTPQIERIISMLRILDMKLTGSKDGETHLIDAGDILYLETVDKKTFIYTTDTVYESGLKLYELEMQLQDFGFIRVGKSCIVHIKHIVSLKAELNRRICVTLSNGEQIVASRQYAEALKQRLGVK